MTIDNVQYILETHVQDPHDFIDHHPTYILYSAHPELLPAALHPSSNLVMGGDGPNAAVMLVRMSPHGVMIFMTGHLAAPPVITTITPPAANC